MKIISRQIIYSGEHTPALSSCSFPSICQLDRQKIFASFKGAPTKAPFNKWDTSPTCISTDGGISFSQPVFFFDPPVVNGVPTTLRICYFTALGNGRVLAAVNAVDASMEGLPYFNKDTGGLKDTYILVALSEDNGLSFGNLQRIKTKNFADLPTPLTGAPVLLGNGDIVIQFEVNKSYYDNEYWVHHSAIIISRDGGKTWDEETIITDCRDVYYWDQRISSLRDGRVMDVFWTYDRRNKKYLNIHACQSMDYGRSFSALWDTGLSGQAGNVVDAGEGRLLLIYINRDHAPVIKIAQSTDDGHAWQDQLTVFDTGKSLNEKKKKSLNDAWSEMEKFSIGHPFIERMADGTLWAYYYSGPSTDRTDFHVVKIVLEL